MFLRLKKISHMVPKVARQSLTPTLPQLWGLRSNPLCGAAGYREIFHLVQSEFSYFELNQNGEEEGPRGRCREKTWIPLALILR